MALRPRLSTSSVPLSPSLPLGMGPAGVRAVPQPASPAPVWSSPQMVGDHTALSARHLRLHGQAALEIMSQVNQKMFFKTHADSFLLM